MNTTTAAHIILPTAEYHEMRYYIFKRNGIAPEIHIGPFSIQSTDKTKPNRTNYASEYFIDPSTPETPFDTIYFCECPKPKRTFLSDAIASGHISLL